MAAMCDAFNGCNIEFTLTFYLIGIRPQFSGKFNSHYAKDSFEMNASAADGVICAEQLADTISFDI